MILVDTSIWVSFFNTEDSKELNVLSELIEENKICLCPTIIQEILQGVRDDKKFVQIKDVLLAFDIIELDTVNASIGAAELYRKGRKNGFTIRKSNDCLIAWFAIQKKIPIYSIDRDFAKIAEFTALELFTP